MKKKVCYPKKPPQCKGLERERERVKESVRTLKGQYSKKYDN